MLSARERPNGIWDPAACVGVPTNVAAAPPRAVPMKLLLLIDMSYRCLVSVFSGIINVGEWSAYRTEITTHLAPLSSQQSACAGLTKSQAAIVDPVDAAAQICHVVS